MDSNDTTTRLTAADEKASAQKLRENYAREAFPDWPNEAGVSVSTAVQSSMTLRRASSLMA